MDDNTRNQILEKIQPIRVIFSCIALLFIFCVLGYLCVDALEKKMYLPAIGYGFLAFAVLGPFWIMIFAKLLVVFLAKRYNTQPSSQEAQSEE
ncbi:hypothetical protein [Dictyobacter aurantiacus]|uniref:Uncharacterized protein n=1 Tax=Dictyobacter aurantiacus TaxID=1936993 RepID=A0A401ZHJ4_9CHLR|nr:hypothetical protein [Dictyobacter aurantiacus]GCE06354.1 hypothetical protein KDAU_36830 [Dictyobacter aurantiacus]